MSRRHLFLLLSRASRHIPLPTPTVVPTRSVTEVSSSCSVATIFACGRRIRSAEDRIHRDLCISFSSILTLLSTAHLNIAPVIPIIFSSPVMQNHTLHLQQSQSFSWLYSLHTFFNSTLSLNFLFSYNLFLKHYFHLLDRNINAWNRNQFLLFLILSKNELPSSIAPYIFESYSGL